MQDHTVFRIIKKIIVVSYNGSWLDIRQIVEAHRADLLTDEARLVLEKMIIECQSGLERPILEGVRALLQYYRNKPGNTTDAMNLGGLRRLQAVCSLQDLDHIVTEHPDLHDMPGVSSLKIILFLHELIQAMEIREKDTSKAHSLILQHETWLCTDFVGDLVTWQEKESHLIDQIGKMMVILGLNILSSILSNDSQNNPSFITVADACNKVAQRISNSG